MLKFIVNIKSYKIHTRTTTIILQSTRVIIFPKKKVKKLYLTIFCLTTYQRLILVFYDNDKKKFKFIYKKVKKIIYIKKLNHTLILTI